MGGRPPLLATKLHAPRRRRGVVGRRRLMERLRGLDRPRLVLVSAPAGFGKSTLLGEWLDAEADAGRCTAWLSLDPRDDEPTAFWSYVVAALRTALPEVGAATLAAIEATPGDPTAAAAALAHELTEVDREVVLVLDDYHVVESADVHESVAFLLDQLPPNVLVAIATRVDPPLPLARLRARRELAECRAADLRFTADEATRYFNDTMGLGLEPGVVEALEARTEGWIAALQLAAISLQGRDDVASFVDNFTGDDRFVVDYLVEEVLERQTPEVRRFLLATSVLSRLSGDLCDAVLGGRAGRSTLEHLDRSNLFLVPLDDRRVWYRYHHLFADVLRAHLVAEAPETVPELHRRAAAWYTEHGDPVEAIGHALDGADVGRAAELIELTAPSLHRVRQEAVVRGWLEALPPEVFDDRPVLAVALVGARMSTGDASGVDELLTNAERWLAQPGEDALGNATPVVVDTEQFAKLPAQVAIYRAALALLTGDVPATIAHADRALSLVDPADDLQRASATALVGLARWSLGDLTAARAHYRSAIDHLKAAGHVADALGCLLGMADMCRAQGRLGDASDALAEGLDLVARHPGLRGAADMHAALSELLLDRNDVPGAREQLDVALALGESAGLPQHPYRWRVAAARLAEVEGDADGAVRLLDEAAELYDTDFSPSVRPIPALRARLDLRRGDLSAAARWAARSGLSVQDDLAYVREFEHLTLAAVLVAQEVRDRVDHGATPFLQRLLDSAEGASRSGAVVEALLLLGVSRHAAGDRAGAASSVGRALELGAVDGHVRVFADQGPPLAAILRSTGFEGVAAAHAARVLAGTRPGAVAASTSLVEPLSDRELDVLRLLRSELSGPDIARELIVSLNTVRTHTKNIYAKLGATNRREAVRRADELGI